MFYCRKGPSRVAAIVLVPALLAGCGVLPGSYVFDPADLEEIAGDVNATSGEAAVVQVQGLLKNHPYPIRTNLSWEFNTGSGVPSQTAALYLSAKEYLLLGNANAGSQWTLGPYVGVSIYDYVLFGDLEVYTPGVLEPLVLGQGGSVALLSGQSLVYQTTNGVWVMEYGRGILPADLYPEALASPFGIVQDAILYAGDSLATNFIRNWVYGMLGIPSSIFSLLGGAGT